MPKRYKSHATHTSTPPLTPSLPFDFTVFYTVDGAKKSSDPSHADLSEYTGRLLVQFIFPCIIR